MTRHRTDTARIDWLISNKADVSYVSPQVGVGWVREEGWRIVLTLQRRGASGKTLRQAIDTAMEQERATNEQ